MKWNGDFLRAGVDLVLVAGIKDVWAVVVAAAAVGESAGCMGEAAVLAIRAEGDAGLALRLLDRCRWYGRGMAEIVTMEAFFAMSNSFSIAPLSTSFVPNMPMLRSMPGTFPLSIASPTRPLASLSSHTATEYRLCSSELRPRLSRDAEDVPLPLHDDPEVEWRLLSRWRETVSASTSASGLMSTRDS